MKRDVGENSPTAILRLWWAGAVLALSSFASADSGYYLKPSVSVFTLYDDNIFYTFSNEVSAKIIRLTPSLELGFEKPNLTWKAIYRIDAEDYIDNESIETGVKRRFADGSLEYRPTPKLIFNTDVRYTKTDTPADLSLVPGGRVQGPLLGRTNAKRTTVHPALSYRLTPTATATLSYLHTEDSIADILDTDIRRVVLDMEHAISPRTVVSYGYFDRQVRYDETSPPPDSEPTLSQESSNTTWLGLSQNLTPTTVASIRGGARVSGGSTDPYWLFSLEREYPFGEAEVTFERNETTAPGTTGRQEFETVNASLTYKSGLNWVTTLASSYAKIKQFSDAQKIYRFLITSTYQFSDSWFMTGSYERNHQPIEFSEDDDEAIDRNVVLVGVTYVYPN